MVKCLLALCLLGLNIDGFSQGYIGSSRKNVKKGLDKYIVENKLKAAFRETDSTLTLLIRTDTLYPTDFVYGFDASGKCIVETRTSCDSCIKKYLDFALHYGKLEWTQLSPRRYVSQFSRKLVLDIEENNTAFSIRKVKWTRSEYEKMVGEAKAE